MEADQNGEQRIADTEADNLAEESSVSPEDKGEVTDCMAVIEPNLDESGATEASEYAGIELPEEDAEVNVVDLTASQEETMEPEPEGDEPKGLASETAAQDSKYVPEQPITHFKNMVNRKVFAATPELMKRRDLMPCDEKGKLVHDHRVF